MLTDDIPRGTLDLVRLMRDRTRRTELGKMFVDVAKYIVTIVVIGGLFTGQVGFGVLLLGILLALLAGATGFHVIPEDEEEESL